MSSVTEYITCPLCNTEEGAVSEFNHKSGDECIHCPNCGYHRRFYISNWADKDLEYPEGESWLPKYDIFECLEPYGAFEVRYVEGFGECGTFLEAENEEEFLDQVDKLKDTIESATISKLVDGKIIKTQVI